MRHAKCDHDHECEDLKVIIKTAGFKLKFG